MALPPRPDLSIGLVVAPTCSTGGRRGGHNHFPLLPPTMTGGLVDPILLSSGVLDMAMTPAHPCLRGEGAWPELPSSLS